MILITGAAGKTGQAVISALSEKKQALRAFVRNEAQSQLVRNLGANEIWIGDLTRGSDIEPVFNGIQKVLHICPNVHSEELSIGELMIAAAIDAGVDHFVFHSVLHPQIEAMPHHWQKMRVEEQLIESGLPFTIVQSASYMQNLLPSFETAREKGSFRVPYDLHQRHSMVDLDDVAEAYARILSKPGHKYATYELASPEALDQHQIAESISQRLNKPVTAVQESIQAWRDRASGAGMSDYALDTLAKMFAHYDQHGFVGNPNMLQHLLQRPPTTFTAFLERIV